MSHHSHTCYVTYHDVIIATRNTSHMPHVIHHNVSHSHTRHTLAGLECAPLLVKLACVSSNTACLAFTTKITLQSCNLPAHINRTEKKWKNFFSSESDSSRLVIDILINPILFVCILTGIASHHCRNTNGMVSIYKGVNAKFELVWFWHTISSSSHQPKKTSSLISHT